MNWLRLMAITLFATLCILTVPEAYAQDNWIDIPVGKSEVRDFPGNVTAIAITDPKVARIQQLASRNRYQIQGVSTGSTDLIVTLEGKGKPLRFEITVHQDLSDLINRIEAIVEGEPPRVYHLNDHIVLQGPIDDLDTLEQVALVASVFDEDFVNLMSVRGDHQVQLEVVFAEVSRSGLRELGVNLWWNRAGTGSIRSDGPNSISAQSILDSNGNQVVLAPAAGSFDIIGSFVRPLEIATIFSIMDDYRLTKVLAQPTLISLSGQQAEFLSGGEIPVPAPGGVGTVQVTFKEYGVKLSFVPTVLAGDVIDLRVHIEVSDVDYANVTRIAGLEVPGFISRKSRSHVRIASGMTFAVAGLLHEDTQYEKAQFPLLGDIPIIGNLFRYIRHARSEKELMIFVTPRLVRPLGPGEVPAAPGTTEDNNTTDLQFFLLGLDRRPGSRTAQPAGSIGLQR
ncbi:MAG: pilus assembly protein CpaC [Kiritimatiellia bacterium]|jgi:pilus assembly protein CpaC